MHMIMQAPEPDDYVVATGETHTIGEFLSAVEEAAGCSPVSVKTIEERPVAVDLLRGDARKIFKTFGWYAHRTYKDIASIMYDAAVKRIS
jgi:GDPmannose 4,6-dehydratase